MIHWSKGMASTLLLLSSIGCSRYSLESEANSVGKLIHRPPVPQQVIDEASLDTSRAKQAAVPHTLTAEDAVRVALNHNRELRARFKEIGVAQGGVQQAGLLPNPTVELELLPERESLVEVSLEYDLTSALLTPRRRAAKTPDIEAARLRAAGAVINTGARARVSFVQAQAASARLIAARQILDTISAQREASDALKEAGNINQLRWAAERAAQEQARLVVAELEVRAVEAREQLIRAMGIHGDNAEFSLAAELQQVPTEVDLPLDLENKVVEANFTLRASRASAESLGKSASYTRLEGNLPDVDVDIHALRRNPRSPASEEEERDVRFGGGIRMSIPLFDRSQGKVRSLTSSYDAALERYVGLATNLRSQTRQAYARLIGAQTRALHLSVTVRQAQEDLMKQTLLQYNAMQIDVFSLLNAAKQKLETELAIIDASEEYWVAQEELSALLKGGQLVPSSGPEAAGFASIEDGGH